jgi:uridine kinase
VSSFVVAATGASGAGKTTLVRAVAERLGDATCFFFDDYERSEGAQAPKDLSAWLAGGADPRAWSRPVMADHLYRLKNGEAVTSPRHGTLTKPAAYIVMEEPFGRRRPEIRELVDFVVCIDVPLEVALSRRLLEYAERAVDPAKFLDSLKSFLTRYLHAGSRETYVVVNRMAMEECELVVDGTRDPNEIADEVAVQ